MSTTVHSRIEEAAHAATHGLGAIASLVGLPILLIAGARSGDPLHLLASLLFGISLVLMYAASTAYHAAPHGTLKQRLKALDHAAIYVLIAGTYSPFLLVTFRDSFGPALMAILWTAALAGVVFKVFAAGRFEKLSLAIYLLMGWAILFVGETVLDTLSPTGLWLLVGGGLAYTVGVAFYTWRSLRFHHAIWHLFVLAGSVLHYFAILFHVY